MLLTVPVYRVMDALGKFGAAVKKIELRTLALLSCSPNFSRASITPIYAR